MYCITQNTYPHRALLKALGCKWNPQAKAWETANPATYRQALEVTGALKRGVAPVLAPTPQPLPMVTEDIRVEYPSRGATYCHAEYGVYKYGTYPRNSVLAGQQSRQYLGSYPTMGEALQAHPGANVTGCGYQEPYLGHLPDDEQSWGEEDYAANHNDY